MKIAYSIFVIGLLTCVTLFNVSSSDGLSEKACATCHGGNIDNENGLLYGKDIPDSYIPGMTYEFDLCLVDTKQIAAGFRLSASAGYLEESPKEEMVKIIGGEATHSGRTLLENDTACWKINWIAPSGEINNVEFVARAASVNADFTEHGDFGGYYHISSANLKSVNYGPLYAKMENHTVHLIWSTIHEIGNKKFTIEKSTNGTNWNIVGEKPGTYKSTSLQKYKFSDLNPSWGINYYRLSQTNFRGTKTYHPEILKVFIANPEHLIKNQYAVGEKIQFGKDFQLMLLDLAGNKLSQTVAGQLLIPEIQEGIYFLKSENSLSQVLITR